MLASASTASTPRLHHLLPGPDSGPPELRERDVEVQQVVRVEDDALGITLAVADA